MKEVSRPTNPTEIKLTQDIPLIPAFLFQTVSRGYRVGVQDGRQDLGKIPGYSRRHEGTIVSVDVSLRAGAIQCVQERTRETKERDTRFKKQELSEGYDDRAPGRNT